MVSLIKNVKKNAELFADQRSARAISKDGQNTMDEILRDLKQNDMVLQMKDYVQHGQVSTYAHCENVARVCFAVNRRFGLGADEESLLKGALLHDFFLYDWHDRDKTHRLHGFRHAKLAAENASRYLNVNEKVCQSIRCHMWPLNLWHLPKSREAWIICFADKFCSLSETLFQR